MAVAVFTNNASSTLGATITAIQTTITVQSGDEGNFPSPTGGDWFPVTVVDGSGNLEIMKCTARSGVTLTVTRAQEGTTGYAFTSGASVELRLTAAAIADVFANASRLTTGTLDKTLLNVSANIATLLATANYAAARTALAVYSSTEVDTAITAAIDALKNSVDAAGDTLAELYALIQALQSGKEDADADILKADQADQLGVGYDHAIHDLGTLDATDDPVRPDIANGHRQKMVSNGCDDLDPPTDYCDIQLTITLGASAAVLDTAGWDKVDGPGALAFETDTTSGNIYKCYISTDDVFGSHLTIIPHPGNT